MIPIHAEYKIQTWNLHRDSRIHQHLVVKTMRVDKITLGNVLLKLIDSQGKNPREPQCLMTRQLKRNPLKR